MKKKLLPIIILAFVFIATTAQAQDSLKNVVADTVKTTQEAVIDTDEPVVAQEQATTEEQSTGKKGKKPRKAPKPLPTIDEIIASAKEWRSSGEPDLDKFFENTVLMVVSFKEVSDSINHIKIETVEIEDEGDGVTQAVKITDQNGNPRTKEALLAKNASIVINLTAMGIQAANSITTGINFGTAIASDPMKALSLLFAIKQLKTATQALRVLGREIPIAIEKVKTQTALVKQMKGN